jgi:hypothetical protein
VSASTPEQRAEAARLLALRAGECWYPEYADAGERLLELVPALLADAEALAAADTALAAIFAEYDELTADPAQDYGDVGSLFELIEELLEKRGTTNGE